MKFYRNPEQSKRISKEELDYIQSEGRGSAEAVQKSPIKWRQLFKHRSMWGMILGFFCTIWIWNIFLNFLPHYLLKNHHVQLKDLGIYANPWIGGIVGDILGGILWRRFLYGYCRNDC